ncbi:peptidyl-prolyl cis-trans isomerase precursor (PPIase) (Rotamase) [Burkholderiales bacterium 8X]|nr:peptidyl-prolyl cis-trans isomerase precursor (PPIase) (Rotamase) [Burkholderiales bacterium 8X]
MSNSQGKPQVELTIKGYGAITLELDAEKAPDSVKNFLDYVNKGHYDNTVFHRVIPGFMVQGGGFEPGMSQKATGAGVKNEANNGLKNDNYTVAMARTSDPHSATAQFFINVADNGFLNHTAPTAQGWGYAVFGKVVEGKEVVDRIKAVKTGRKGFHDDVPLEDVVIEKAVVKA